MSSSASRPRTGAGVGSAARREVVRWALLGTLLLLLAVVVDVSRHGGNNLVSLIQPGADGPATAVVALDFPEIEQPAGVGLDGQLFYAVARNPLHLDEVAAHLDRPRYRLQRPLLPWIAWAAQPTGGGLGLVAALAGVGLAAAFLGALATGALSVRWHGPAWAAALFPILPGAWWAVRTTTSDALALALALAAIALADRGRRAPAVAVGVLAVLAKEPAILVLAGWVLHRRTRRDLALVVGPGLAIVAWMAWLRFQLPADPPGPDDLGLPFLGLVDAWQDQWSRGQELVGMACSVGGLLVGTAALVLRRLRHPLGWAIAVQLGFLLCMGLNPTAMNFGATRMAMPVTVLGLLALLTPGANRAEDDAVADRDCGALPQVPHPGPLLGAS